jgi:hypothetical protein
MIPRVELYRSGASLEVGANLVIDLPRQGVLSSIYFHVYKGAVNDSMIAIEKWRMLDYLSEIKVVAPGGDNLKFMTGRMAHVLQHFDGGGAAPDKHFNYATSTKRHHGVLNFGRWPFDTQFGLDLSRFNAMELRISNDAASGQFSSALSVDVLLGWLTDVPTGRMSHYCRSEEYQRWTTVTGDTQYIDLPSSGLLRRALLQVDPSVDATYKTAEATLYSVISNVKMTRRSGAQEIYNGNPRHLWYVDYLSRGRDAIQALEPYHSDAYGIRTGLGQSLGAAGLRLPQGGTQNTYGTGIWPGDDSSTLRRTAGSDTTQDSLLVMGLGLENTFPVYNAHFDEQEFMIDLDREKTVEVDVTTGSSASHDDATARLYVERIMPLPA